MRYEPNLWGHVTCPQCGKGFMSDCGPDFCSASCERTYEKEHQECTKCGEEYHEDDLNKEGICGNCEEEEE